MFNKNGGFTTQDNCSCGVSCGKESSQGKNIGAKAGSSKKS